MEIAVCEKSEARAGLDALVPAILLDGFLRAKLANRIVAVAGEVGRIEEVGVVAKEILRGHRRDPAAVGLVKRSQNAAVLFERLMVLFDHALVMRAERGGFHAGRGINRDAIREKDGEIFPAQSPHLHFLPVAVEPLVPNDGRPRIRLTTGVRHLLVSEKIVAVIGIDGPPDLHAGRFVEAVQKLPVGFVKRIERLFAGVPKVRHLEGESLRDGASPVEFVPDEQVVAKPAVRRFHRGKEG